jgi:hypothetical protein
MVLQSAVSSSLIKSAEMATEQKRVCPDEATPRWYPSGACGQVDAPVVDGDWLTFGVFEFGLAE